MALPAGFLDRLNNPLLIVDRTVFQNAHGSWAKAWLEVVTIFVDFDDGYEYQIDPADFRTLTRAQQEKIRHAPSSPLPE
jgi:hypothetical protein